MADANLIPDFQEGGADSRLEEMRGFARDIAHTQDLLPTLHVLADRLREVTNALAVAIERHSPDKDEPVRVAWSSAGLRTAALDDEHPGRVVIALGRSTGRLGSVVLWRDRDAPAADMNALDRVGDLTAMIGVAMRRQWLEDQLSSARRAQVEATENKFRLINGIAEELRNRLGVAAEFAQLLETEGELTPSQTEYIESSRHGIETAVRLINELSQLVRAETGRLALQIEPVDIAAVFRGVVRDFELSVGTLDVDLYVVVPDELPALDTDIDLVSRIVDDLLSNAVRFSESGGRIAVLADVRPGRRSSDPSKYVCVSVSDTGPGVEDHERVFEEVYRVERQDGASGFRLAISRRIARLLGGDLTIESPDSGGSTFTLWLPARARPDQEIPSPRRRA